MILLDTHVISALISSGRDETADDWLDRMEPAELWRPTLVVSELKYGIDIMEDGRRRKRMETAFRKLIEIAFAERIIGFDLDAAVAAAAIGADRKRRGRPFGEDDYWAKRAFSIRCA